MAKQLNGIVVSSDMKDTVIVEVTRKVAHPIYKKLLKRTKKFKADTREVKAAVGDQVSIVETRPLSKDKHFKIGKVLVAKVPAGAKKEETK
jgi:small subunit ribosomal protein S17